MANELVLGQGMDPATVAAMDAATVRYWYSAAVERQKKIAEQLNRGQ